MCISIIKETAQAAVLLTPCWHLHRRRSGTGIYRGDGHDYVR